MREDWSANDLDGGAGRFKWVTPDWRSFNYISVSDDDARSNPPPPLQGSGPQNGQVYELEPECAPGKRLDVEGSGNANQTQVWIYSAISGSLAQRWRFEAQSDGSFELIPLCAPDQRLDVEGASPNEGAEVWTYQDFSSAAQRWKFYDVGNGLYEIEPQCAPGKRLDVVNGENADRANVKTWLDLSNSAQRWRLIPVSGDPSNLSAQ